MDDYVVNGSQTIRLPRTATEPVVMELIGAYNGKSSATARKASSSSARARPSAARGMILR